MISRSFYWNGDSPRKMSIVVTRRSDFTGFLLVKTFPVLTEKACKIHRKYKFINICKPNLFILFKTGKPTTSVFIINYIFSTTEILEVWMTHKNVNITDILFSVILIIIIFILSCWITTEQLQFGQENYLFIIRFNYLARHPYLFPVVQSFITNQYRTIITNSGFYWSWGISTIVKDKNYIEVVKKFPVTSFLT